MKRLAPKGSLRPKSENIRTRRADRQITGLRFGQLEHLAIAVRAGILALSALFALAVAARAGDPVGLQVAHWTLSSAADWKAGSLEGLAVVADNQGQVALSLDVGHATGRFTSDIYRAPFPFSAAAPYWTSNTQDGNGVAVELRLSQDGVAWNAWHPITHPETQADGHTYAENMVLLDGAEFVQVRVTLSTSRPGRFPQLTDLTVVLIDTRGAPSPAQAKAASAPIRSTGIDQPAIISRQGWGADPAYLDWDPEYAPAERLVLHHTVTAGSGNPVGEVQAIYYYHAVTRGWGDIGYNYLVDPAGNIYEGRYGGNDVIGAHTARWNRGALGIALLGCYHAPDCSPEQTPSAAALDALADLVGWTASRRVLDPRQTAVFTNVYQDPPLTLQRLAGHRDYRQRIDGQWYNATACPGDTLYAELGVLRDAAWSRLPADDARFEDHDTPDSLVPGQSVGVSLNVRNAGVAAWTPGEIYLGYRWFDPAGGLVSQKTDAAPLSGEIPFGESTVLAAILSAPPVTGTYKLPWDLFRPGAGWFAELSPVSEPLEVPATVRDPAHPGHRAFLPLIIAGQVPD